MYRLLDGTNESELFAVYVEKDAFYIELVTTEDAADYRLPDWAEMRNLLK